LRRTCSSSKGEELRRKIKGRVGFSKDIVYDEVEVDQILWGLLGREAEELFIGGVD